jgi:hypothetical protein
MPLRTHAYGPDQLKVLQQIFDSIWQEIKQKGRVQPHDENMRRYISGLVMSHAVPDFLDVEGIKRKVRRSLKMAS